MNHLFQSSPSALDVLFSDPEDTDTEVFESLIDEEIEPPGNPSPPDQTQSDRPIDNSLRADIQLMRLIYLQERMNEIDNLFQKELNRLTRWKERRQQVLQNQYDFFSRTLENWLTGSNSKSMNLPHGTIAFRKLPPHVEILDEQRLLTADEFVRIKRSVDRTAILQAYREHGLIPDGCDIIEPEPKFTIKLNPKRKEPVNVQPQNPPAAG